MTTEALYRTLCIGTLGSVHVSDVLAIDNDELDNEVFRVPVELILGRMGVSGLFKELGPGQRISVAKLSATHFTTHGRPLRLAIDVSIWLFQILASKGGSNPALRTFYYRLLRLLSLNIHPLFVFDGPNKPTFKRNKRVGGPGVRVASVPEFLAKELLRKFGFPWHVAPGEAEAECALLQREGVVDAVLSEDVDTLMFGSGVLWRNWTAEGKGKVPTHCSVYNAKAVKEKSGLDREGMVLVALMSGGDYIVEGIPGCGPKVGCDAARAGFGKELCALARKRDVSGLKIWREKLQHEINTNESKFFSRKSSKLVIPDDFPDREVLGYYTDPCVSTVEKVARLKAEMKWDLDMDFPALRAFAGDAFDWRCLGGAKKFIKNLAPAMLVRELRLMGQKDQRLDTDEQAEKEQEYVRAIHGKRNHATTDNELEYRISFIPQSLVPIDLSIEDEDDDFVPAGGADELETEDEWAQIPSSTQDESDAPNSPTKKRTFKPYHPDQPEKAWMMRDFLKMGCPLLVEQYEDKSQDPKEFFKQRRKAKAAAAKGDGNVHAKKSRRKKNESDPTQMPIDVFGTITKSSQTSVQGLKSSQDRESLKAVNTSANVVAKKTKKVVTADTVKPKVPGFRMPTTQLSPTATQDDAKDLLAHALDTDDEETPRASRVIPPVKDTSRQNTKSEQPASQRTPLRRKRRSDDLASPAMSQMSIKSWLSPSAKKPVAQQCVSEVISLLSSSPVIPADPPRPDSPTPERLRGGFLRTHRDNEDLLSFSPGKLPDSITKRRKKAPLKRAKTAPSIGNDDLDPPLYRATSRPSTPDLATPLGDTVEAMDLASPIPIHLTPPLPAPPTESKSLKSSSSSSTSVKSRPPSLSTTSTAATLRRSPRQFLPQTYSSSSTKLSTQATKTTTTTNLATQQVPKTKMRIIARESLPGAWKEVEAETLDLTGDGSGWKQSRGGAVLVSSSSISSDQMGKTRKTAGKSWRKSEVEVLDLTGA